MMQFLAPCKKVHGAERELVDELNTFGWHFHPAHAATLQGAQAMAQTHQQTVYVNAWDSDGSGGFDWYPDSVTADRAFEAEKRNCTTYAGHRWTAYRFDLEVPASLSADQITHHIAADLRHYCDTATRKHGVDRSALHYAVTFESVGFTAVNLDGQELGEEEARGYTDTALAEGSLPVGVFAVLRGHIAEDDAQPAGDRKVFVSITLEVAAATGSTATAFAPPVDLLTVLADRLGVDEHGQTVVHLEGNWQCVDVDTVDDTSPMHH
ncbi:hypothetical protein VI03_25400 [Burkholderia vietnamiensis]|uniref:hypothetical protein n=1 Tax=Burkholderia vietnamiensis TaxID=60552 RepID=UPI0006225DED|nr:hypothetical protein [Burkholderia vietnamiensis]KKI36110.1 hypothetical protein VI03_25400 [Burkholderia vietnamiensis]